MPWGGRRAHAGPPKGVISLSTRAILEATISGGEMPIADMLRVMRDEDVPDLRRDAMARLEPRHLAGHQSRLRYRTSENNTINNVQ